MAYTSVGITGGARIMLIHCSFHRVSDRGGGIPHHLTARALDYNFTTANSQNTPEQELQEGVFTNMMEAVNPNPAGGPMHGLVSNNSNTQCFQTVKAANRIFGNWKLISVCLFNYLRM